MKHKNSKHGQEEEEKNKTKTKCRLERTHTAKYQRAFVIQQQPVVIDWSICLCVAYKWATWYSALFIWNQLRQRCCVSACCMRALSLCRLLIPCLRRRDSGQEKTRWRREHRASAGRRKKRECVCVCMCGRGVQAVDGWEGESACVQFFV